MSPQSSATLQDMNFTGLTSDSRKVKPGYLFAALSGSKTDGAKFVKDAVSRGAIAVLGAPSLEADVAALGARFIPDANPRLGLARYAAAFYPAQPAVIAAITGTKGKSSIVAFLREIWTALGKPAASLGTVGVISPKGETPLNHTTTSAKKTVAAKKVKKKDLALPLDLVISTADLVPMHQAEPGRPGMTLNHPKSAPLPQGPAAWGFRHAGALGRLTTVGTLRQG